MLKNIENYNEGKLKKDVSLIRIFVSMFKVGIMTFGGGYAMLPIIDRELIENNRWITKAELLDYFAISQCTPGTIAVNTATFIGKKLRGNIGSLVATLGVISPSILIIMGIAAVMRTLFSFKIIQYAMAGIRICVCVLIFNAVIKLFKSAVIDIFTSILYIVVLISSVVFKVSPIIIVILSIILGISSLYIKKEGDKK